MIRNEALTREALKTLLEAALDIDGATSVLGRPPYDPAEDLARLVKEFNKATGWELNPAAGTILGAPDSLTTEVLADLLYAAAYNATY